MVMRIENIFRSETNRIEYKRQLTDNLEREVVAFLNYHEGGLIYIGVDKTGDIIGVEDIDKMQLKIVDRIKNNISPSTLGLFDVIIEKAKGRNIIKILISSGTEKPYYIKSKGMSESGCFIRVGSSVQPMTTPMINDLYSKRNRQTLGNMPSPRKDLTFEQLNIYYQAKNLKLNDKFKNALEFLNYDGRDNYISYMMADENGISVKVAKYAGTTKVDLVENEEYGYCCLVKAAKTVLEKFEVENRTFAKITSNKRLERQMVDKTALREAVINAIVHNDYSRGVPPLFEIFSDKIKITSYGGLVEGLSKEDFFNCCSVPRNRELMRVFKDLDLVEHLGSGMSRILAIYDESIFEFTPNFLIVTFPFAKGFSCLDTQNGTNLGTNGINFGTNDINQTQIKILNLLRTNPKATIDNISKAINLSRRTITRELKLLQEIGIIHRVGSTRGHWEVEEFE